MNAPEVWWSPSLAEDLSQGGLIERTGPDLWHQEHGLWHRLDELPADAVRLVPATLNSELKVGAVPDTGQAREPATIYRRGLKQRIEKTRYRYWGKGGEINVPELTDQVLGFLHEQGVKVADDDWAPRSPAGATVQAPEVDNDAFGVTCIDCGEAVTDDRPSGETEEGPVHYGCGDTVQTPDVAALAYARSEVDKWLASSDPYCILPTRTEHLPALLARLDELEGTS